MANLLLAASARATTESLFANAQQSGDGEEGFSAELAGAFNNSKAMAARSYDEEFAVSDPSSCSGRIADPAGRNEVVLGIVQRIAVEMIRDQHTSSVAVTANSNAPGDFCTAPMTAMRSCADPLVEDVSRFGDDVALSTKRMIFRHHTNTTVGSAVLLSWSLLSHPSILSCYRRFAT